METKTKQLKNIISIPVVGSIFIKGEDFHVYQKEREFIKVS
jgi:hypothetical protein